ncbi:MAG: GspE/PulE family protein [Patescibacteria group bacterium]|nr:GspE/PulE family protein [Patescibacteria group bacterium]
MATLKQPKTPSIEDLFKKKAAQTPVAKTGKPGYIKGAPSVKKSEKKQKSPSEMSQVELLDFKQKEIQTSDIEKRAESEASQKGLPFINLRGFPVSPEALILIDEEEAKKYSVLAFAKLSEDIRIATSKPSDEVNKIAERLAKAHLSDVQVYFCSEQSMAYGLDLYKTLPKIIESTGGVTIESDKLKEFESAIANFKELQERLEASTTTDLVSLILAAALKGGASDIHIEAEEESIKIRLRVDGILHEAASINKDKWKLIISRIKLLAGMKINITSVPQDGRITIYLSSEKIEIRVSTLPTAYGESVVMRLLRPKSISLDFEELGVRGLAWERLKAEIERPNGMIVTTGPTGSGKTTTLYAILKRLNTPEVKIITLEDPVEYKLAGINQSQIDHSKNYTFGKGLRSILRQDPDIVMVGEIRDTETAEIATQAALTGHLVISTIHTNNAAGAIPRFLSMGVKPFFLAPALNCVIGQRLVRRLCADCKAPIKLDDALMAEVQNTLKTIPESANIKLDLNNLQFYGPSEKTKTCKTCNGLGYSGRMGIYEIFTMNKEIERMILDSNVSEYDMLDVAQKHGMITMAQDGILKALDGITSVEEVLRVAGIEATIEDADDEEIEEQRKEE